ncbi:MAG TPA: hypothetical protein VF791_22780 [Pyrinomonadaceae bacterium]
MLVFILALTALGIESLPARAQKARPGAVYAQPARVRLEGLIRRRFPSFYGKAFPQEQLIIEEFYPIGWSKDGKFAYYTEPGDEACGCYFAHLVIIDLVSDKVMWSFDYDSSEAEDAGRKKPPVTIRALWRENQKLFSGKLRQYNIQPGVRFSVLRFPANHKGDQLRTELKIKENRNEETSPYGIVEQGTLQLISSRQGKKTVLEQNYVKQGEDFQILPLDLKVLGYLKSPFEPRAALMLIEVWRGYEGPPHTTRIKITGSSLTTGFK